MRIFALALLLALQANAPQATLGSELRDHGVVLPPGVDGRQPITSFATLDDNLGVVIAYYDAVRDGGLHTLNVRAFDRRTHRWRAATFEPTGSVLSVTRVGDSLYLEGHASPSSGPLLVLSADLRFRHEMDGWIVFTTDDHRVLFVRGMRHFAPTHAEALAVYDPVSNRDVTIYPATSDNDRGAERDGDLWIDRDIGDIAKGTREGTVVFPVTVQRMQIESDNQAHEAGPKARLSVTCDLSPRVPVCRDTPSRAAASPASIAPVHRRP
jgi:hypothetical protein